jgi:hypothetical protein
MIRPATSNATSASGWSVLEQQRFHVITLLHAITPPAAVDARNSHAIFTYLARQSGLTGGSEGRAEA